ncbi:MAG: dethiobiotin synthase [Spirochaetae bacterium HGW-Spirochaetae-6]|nr:MAG: dethiobiotin synthase [Spirochaetae bacterium HGW-Spirochaetae-6]
MIYFITGIDTSVGKTFATGLMARYLLQKGYRVVTHKLTQTGSAKPAEDIQIHRKLMGIDLLVEDHSGLTCPYTFPLPASPHLAAQVAGEVIDPDIIRDSLTQLEKKYTVVLLEGAGGIMVPLSPGFTTLDFLAQLGYPTLVVTSPRLGSINHALLTLKVLQGAKIPVQGILYNLFEESSPLITQDTREYLACSFPEIPVIDLPLYSETDEDFVLPDFSPFFRVS